MGTQEEYIQSAQRRMNWGCFSGSRRWNGAAAATPTRVAMEASEKNFILID